MQTKSSYRVLKWTFMVGAVASLATACVVSVGDGSGNTLGEAGDSGTTTAGKPSDGGSSAKGGSSSTAGTGNSAAGEAGSGTATGTGGKGGTSSGTGGTSSGTGGTGGDAYVAGLCQADNPTPTMEPSCDLLPKDNDADRVCAKCMKSKCCSEWKTCFGEAPTTACGYGATADADGQFLCIVDCFDKGKANATDADTLLSDCTAGCANQCDTVDNGLPLDSTNELVACANTSCQTECFPF